MEGVPALDQYGNVLPYQFEPKIGDDDLPEDETSSEETSSEDDSLLEELDEERLGNADWCTCGHCMAMSTVKESICCLELDGVGDKLDGFQCITQNPRLKTVVLNREVLRTALIANMDMRRERLEEPLSNLILHQMSHCQFCFWMHVHPGQVVRKIVPSCVIALIRQTFPQPTGV